MNIKILPRISSPILAIQDPVSSFQRLILFIFAKNNFFAKMNKYGSVFRSCFSKSEFLSPEMFCYGSGDRCICAFSLVRSCDVLFEVDGVGN